MGDTDDKRPEQGGIHHWIPSPTSPTETNAPAGQGLREDPNGRIHDLKVCPNVGHVTATGQHHHDIDSHGTPRSHVPASGRRPTAVRPANPAHRCAPPSCGSRCPAAWRRAAWHEQRSAITDLDFLPADRAVTGVAMGVGRVERVVVPAVPVFTAIKRITSRAPIPVSVPVIDTHAHVQPPAEPAQRTAPATACP
jgi:hypothetical protein